MAQVIRRFTATIPAGTAKLAPVTVNLSFPPMNVSEIEVVIPPGPRGQMGFKMAMAGVQVFPYSGDDYIVTDNETLHWPIEDAPTSGAWQVIGYNTGAFDHSIEVRFLCELASQGAPVEPQPISNESLSSPAGLN